MFSGVRTQFFRALKLKTLLTILLQVNLNCSKPLVLVLCAHRHFYKKQR